jgi:hypothetical protein
MPSGKADAVRPGAVIVAPVKKERIERLQVLLADLVHVGLLAGLSKEFKTLGVSLVSLDCQFCRIDKVLAYFVIDEVARGFLGCCRLFGLVGLQAEYVFSPVGFLCSPVNWSLSIGVV